MNGPDKAQYVVDVYAGEKTPGNRAERRIVQLSERRASRKSAQSRARISALAASIGKAVA